MPQTQATETQKSAGKSWLNHIRNYFLQQQEQSSFDILRTIHEGAPIVFSPAIPPEPKRTEPMAQPPVQWPPQRSVSQTVARLKPPAEALFLPVSPHSESIFTKSKPSWQAAFHPAQ